MYAFLYIKVLDILPTNYEVVLVSSVVILSSGVFFHNDGKPGAM